MKGSYHFSVYNNKIRYEFDINRNITILKGDSATGKTTLLKMLNRALLSKDSGYTVKTNAKYFVYLEDVYNIPWQQRFLSNKDHVVFIEENNDFVKSNEFLSILQESGCYAVIVSRESIDSLHYSIYKTYGIRQSSKCDFLPKVINEFYELN